ncbi:MAG: glycosyltransferase family 2 protein [Clostridia bacterium]|nr:glycosyltransferase family 2 protein [Clostridia bacterium]
MNELVSIIMPSYNTAKYISQSIESVLNQTYTNWELIIVDDCSTDNTDEIIKTYLGDNRIIYLKNEKNSGAAVSRNYALREAKGKWIAFLDSDDIWLPEKLKKQISFMENHNYNFSYTPYQQIDEASNSMNVYVSGPGKINKRQQYNFCWQGCLTVVYNKEKVGTIEIEDLKKNNDYAIWLKAIEKSDCYLLNEYLAKYRIRTGSISRHSKLKLIKHHYLLYKDGEHKSVVSSCILTMRNLFWGVYKKIKYVKTEG